MPGGSNGSNDDRPDAVTGLVPRQLEAISESWALINAEAHINGMELFIRLFQEYPETHQRFSKLRDCPVEDLRSNSVLISHAEKAMAAITYLVDHLGDSQELVNTIQTLARDHKDMGIRASEFKMVLSVLQCLMKDVLLDKYNIFTEKAWHSCCDVIMSVVDAEMNKVK